MQKFLVGLGVICLILLVVFEVSFFFGAAQRHATQSAPAETVVEQ